MNVGRFYIIFIISFLLVYNLFGKEQNVCGTISGIIVIDDSWEPKVYVSIIPNFEKLNSISKKMVLTNTDIDTTGKFLIDLSFLPDDNKWYLLRLHLIKKGLSPTTLIIGGENENFIYIIANHCSEISLQSNTKSPVFENAELTGESGLETLKYIFFLADYAANVTKENSLIEREFVKEAVRNKLKSIADSCSNPVLALLSINSYDYKTDFNNNPDYYYSFLSKWEREKSDYFNVFRNQLSTKENDNTILFLFLSFFMLLAIVVFMYRWLSSLRFKKLTTQEKKIFEMIKKGASNQDIANEFHIEVNTVKSHVSRIMKKLKVKARKEIIHMR